ncbi:MAG: class II glutamine amidotransferase [Thermogutta sp.]|nr:class II glutamine amidotransferase [Thermogutta sp.]
MLGLVAQKPIHVHLRAEPAASGEGLPHSAGASGWGIGWYDGSRPAVFKYPTPDQQAKDSEPPAHTCHSRVLIAHVREENAAPRPENSHPFHYRNWMFAHCGTVNREALAGLLEQAHHTSLMGGTDSEVLFHWILQNIKKTRDIVDSIRDALRSISSESMQFVLSNGRWIFAYRTGQPLYAAEWNPGKSGRPWSAWGSPIRLESMDLAEVRAVFVGSETVGGMNWEPIPAGRLVAVSPRLDRYEIDLEQEADFVR